jgi:hypothetical protein
LRQCLFVPLQAASACAGFGAANVSDPFAADVDQMLGGEPADSLIVYPDEVCCQTRQSTVDQYIGSLLPFDPKEQIDRGAARSNDQNIEPSCQQLIDFLLLHVGVFLRRGDDQVIPALSQCL